jgi:ELP3 family radical SAM enzyme/protein acetyltransferase
MSCSRSLGDLEDILRGGTEAETIYKNMPLYREIVREIMNWCVQHESDIDIRTAFTQYFIQLTRKYRLYLKKSLLVWVYRQMIASGEIEDLSGGVFQRLLQKTPSRNMSGVTVVTVLTSPYPDQQDFSCKHNCYYCPNEPGQPRSYLADEPAVARANRNGFDARKQMMDRLSGLAMNGHEIDKVEIIIEGGTYTEYPVDYLERFHRDLLYVANTWGHPYREPLGILEERKINETASVHVIGVCVETRPDAIDTEWLKRMRRFGITRVQLGVQHIDDAILKRVNRGHGWREAAAGIWMLKENGFKVDIHLMPDLPGSTPEKDRSMLKDVLCGTIWRPDQVKVYPCSVVPWTVIEKWHSSGKWTPYTDVDPSLLSDVLVWALKVCPPWIRFPRVVRDIPLGYISGGNTKTNLRQMVMDRMKREGVVSSEMRGRECGRNLGYSWKDAELVVRKYRHVCAAEEGSSLDYFISFESSDRRCLFGFCRLRISLDTTSLVFDELDKCGVIRELHVYGNVTRVVGTNSGRGLRAQHRGFGRRLVAEAERLAWNNGCKGMAVISGDGVAGYYRRLGYEWGPERNFMIRRFILDKWSVSILGIYLATLILLLVFRYEREIAL